MNTQMVVPFPDSLGQQAPELIFQVVESSIRNDSNTNYLCFVTLNQQVEKRIYTLGDGTNIYWGIPKAVTIDKPFNEVLNMVTDDHFSVAEFQNRASKDLSLVTLIRLHAVKLKLNAILLHPDRPMIAKYYTWKHIVFDKNRSCDIYHPDFNWDKC